MKISYHSLDLSSERGLVMAERSLPPDEYLRWRKRHALYGLSHSETEKLKRWVHGYWDTIPNRENDTCWLCPHSKLPSRRNGRISKHVYFRTSTGGHQISFNFGIVALLVKGRLTNSHKNMIIKESWELSHLCGNWTCLNPCHFTIESGSINQSRKTCFRRHRCDHDLPCKIVKKRPLSELA